MIYEGINTKLTYFPFKFIRQVQYVRQQLLIQQRWGTLAFIWSVNPTFPLFLAHFTQMLHYVHYLLVAYFSRLLFGVGQEAHNGYLEFFRLVDKSTVLEPKQLKAVKQKKKKKQRDTKTLCRAERNCCV